MKVLIVTYRRPDLLTSCVSHLESYFPMSDLLVVDNKSEDSPEIIEYCMASGIAIEPNAENEGFAKAVNIGMERLLQQSPDRWVLLLNPDAEVLTDPKAVAESAGTRTACMTTFNAADAYLWDCEKPIPNPWRAAWEDSGFGSIRLPQPLGSRYRFLNKRHRGYLVGCYLLIATAAWQRIGPFDERFWLYSEEADWCLRAYRSEMECTVVPVVGYRHHAGQTTQGDSASERQASLAYWNSRKLLLDKHWGRTGTYAYRILVTILIKFRAFAYLVRNSYAPFK